MLSRADVLALPLSYPAQQSQGVVRGQWAPRHMEGNTKGKEREVERKGWGKAEEERWRMVRGIAHMEGLVWRERVQRKGSE